MVRARVLEEREDYWKAVIEGVDSSLLNALRRTIISDVPVLAIDEVIILDNTSILYDEVLAHRISLVPIRTKLDKFPRIEECEAELVDPSLCQVRFELNVEAQEPMVIYSGHLRSSDPDVAPVHEDIPIVKLEKGQKVVLEAYAKLGRARDHVKWQAALASYYYYPRVEVVGKATGECGTCLEICPGGLEIRGEEVVVVNVEACTFNKWKTCESICPAIRVSWDRGKYVFWVEGFGNMPVRDVLKEAFRVLKEKVQGFLREVEEAVRPRPLPEGPSEVGGEEGITSS